MVVRTVAEWEKILRPIIEPRKRAERVLADLRNYFHGRAYAEEDVQQLANALEAVFADARDFP